LANKTKATGERRDFPTDKRTGPADRRGFSPDKKSGPSDRRDFPTNKRNGPLDKRPDRSGQAPEKKAPQATKPENDVPSANPEGKRIRKRIPRK
jgi:hypothetical protein